MQGFPNGLPVDDAEAVILNVAYGLAEMHRDGIIHRHVCLSTVRVPDAPCFDTARSAPAQHSSAFWTQPRSHLHKAMQGKKRNFTVVRSHRSSCQSCAPGALDYLAGLICGGAEQA